MQTVGDFVILEKYLQIVQMLMRRLIWIYTVCKHWSPQRAVGLKGLITDHWQD